MTPEQQRIAIAEACGFERITVDYESFDEREGYTRGADGIWRTPSANKWLRELSEQEVQCVGDYFIELSTGRIFADFDGPDTGVNGMGRFDYLSDLGAMHEAEKTLTLKQRERYYEELGRESGWLTICSTSEQRALAFLRTIGKFD